MFTLYLYFICYAGYYIYTPEEKSYNMSIATLVSPPLLINQECCLSFKYHMFGPDANKLRLYYTEGDHVFSWEAVGNHGDAWYQHKVFFGPSVMDFTFEAIGSGGQSGEIALDEIRIVAGSCDIEGMCHPYLFIYSS